MAITINPIIPNKISRINNKNTITFRERKQGELKHKDKAMLPACLLTALSVGLGVWGYCKLKKRDKIFVENFSKEIEKAQVYLKNIFAKDFDANEANLFLQKYKELNKISDNKEFYKKIFNQLKKDFQVENKNLALEIMEKPVSVKNGIYTGYTEALTKHIAIVDTGSRSNDFAVMMHELRHVKQNELMYKTDPERLVKAKIVELEKSNNTSWQGILNNFDGDRNKARAFVQSEVERVYQENWGHLKPINKTSQEYSLGLKYLENEENRVPPGSDYYKQILEKEAKFVEENARKIFELLSK